MGHEREPLRPPTWRAVLRDYERAVARFRDHPTIPSQVAWELARAELEAELAAPGRVELGRSVATPGAIAAMKTGLHLPHEFLLRHKHADWGDLDAHDRRVNADELARRGRLLSSYATRAGERLWVITDAGWDVTTLLLPEEY